MSQTSRKTLLFSGKLTVVIPTITLSPSSLPGATAETAYNQTVSASGGTAPYAYTITAGALPNGLTLHSATGVIDGTPTTVQNPSFTITATDAFSFTGNKSYSINVVAPTITVPSSPPAGVVATAYSYSFAASGGVGPYTYAVTSGSLPSSLSLNAGTGLLSGTPDRVATSNFTITATDNGGFTGNSGSVSVGVTIVYLIDDEFTTAQGAPLTTPRSADPGPGTLTITDTTNKLSIATAQLIASGGNATDDPWYRETAGRSRAAGLALIASIKCAGANTPHPVLDFLSTLSSPVNTNRFGLFWGGARALNIFPDTALTPFAGTLNSFDTYAIVLQSTGAYVFMNGNLVWVIKTGTDATLFPSIESIGAGIAWNADFFRLRQLAGSVWTTQNGQATLNIASPVTNTDYVGNANNILDITLQAAATILTVGGVKFHYQDSSNYWEAYFDTAGAFKVDTVVAGTPTNQINVAGAITTTATRTIRVVSNGALHDFYTLNGTVMTKRGGQINVVTFDTLAGVHTDFGADWTASNLLSYPLVSTNYVALGDT